MGDVSSPPRADVHGLSLRCIFLCSQDFYKDAAPRGPFVWTPTVPSLCLHPVTVTINRLTAGGGEVPTSSWKSDRIQQRSRSWASQVSGLSTRWGGIRSALAWSGVSHLSFHGFSIPVTGVSIRKQPKECAIAHYLETPQECAIAHSLGCFV